MVQTVVPMTEVKAVIQVYNDERMTDKCMAYLEGDEYRGVVVQAKTVSEALRELAISIDAINQYRINKKL